MPVFRKPLDISTTKSDRAPTKSALIEQVAKHIHGLLLKDYPKVAQWDGIEPEMRCRYLAVAERLLVEPPPGFKRV